VPLSQATLIFENNRKEIYVAKWGQAKDIKRKLILKIGDEEGCTSLKTLQIEKGEVCW
jgi:hypothetical protein